MELNDRKLRILQAIVSSYIDTAEPVGSRTISKNFDLGISPATIRNEMSDLEELGLIMQPHTSSGRIPSDKGYRYYVDMLLQHQPTNNPGFSLIQELVRKADRIEVLLQDIARNLAQETHYATIVSTPKYNKCKIKSIQLIAIEPTKILTVVVTESNAIKNHVIDTDVEVEQSALNRLTYIMNEHLYGLTLEQINLPLIQSLNAYAQSNSGIIPKVLDVVYQTIQSVDDTDIFTSGTTNILKFPEFNDVNKAMELIDALEQKDALINILTHSGNRDGTEISIRIGEEIEVEEMKDCSIITTTYSLGDEVVGTIGIIGPKRMDYMSTIASLKAMIATMEKKINQKDKS